MRARPSAGAAGVFGLLLALPFAHAELTCSSGTVSGSTTNAPDSGYNPSGDVTYTFTATTLTDVTFSLCGSSYDAVVRVLSTTSPVQQLGYCDDDTSNGQWLGLLCAA